MKSSASIAALAAALTAAQSEIRTVGYDSENPHFKSKFASLTKITESVRPILAKHGLAVVQGGYGDLDVQPGVFGVETTLIHASGEWLSTFVEVPLAKKDPQGAGSALTYGRRYGLSALLSVATDEDDDANVASTAPKAAERKPAAKKEAPTTNPAAKPSQRLDAPIDRLPTWPDYKFSGMLLMKAPQHELTRLIEWEPKDASKYVALKEAIVLELDRRRNDNDFSAPHPALNDDDNRSLPF